MRQANVYWERNGLCLWPKRLESEHFKTSPDAMDESIVLNVQELNWLLDGFGFWRDPPGQASPDAADETIILSKARLCGRLATAGCGCQSSSLWGAAAGGVNVQITTVVCSMPHGVAGVLLDPAAAQRIAGITGKGD